jgi:hypothetical protein
LLTVHGVWSSNETSAMIVSFASSSSSGMMLSVIPSSVNVESPMLMLNPFALGVDRNDEGGKR